MTARQHREVRIYSDAASLLFAEELAKVRCVIDVIRSRRDVPPTYRDHAGVTVVSATSSSLSHIELPFVTRADLRPMWMSPHPPHSGRSVDLCRTNSGVRVPQGSLNSRSGKPFKKHQRFNFLRMRR